MSAWLDPSLDALALCEPLPASRLSARPAAILTGDPHWISDQIGHTSAAFTLQVYQQTRNRRL